MLASSLDVLKQLYNVSVMPFSSFCRGLTRGKDERFPIDSCSDIKIKCYYFGCGLRVSFCCLRNVLNGLSLLSFETKYFSFCDSFP